VRYLPLGGRDNLAKTGSFLFVRMKAPRDEKIIRKRIYFKKVADAAGKNVRQVSVPLGKG
jgi:hypothetical protein